MSIAAFDLSTPTESGVRALAYDQRRLQDCEFNTECPAGWFCQRDTCVDDYGAWCDNSSDCREGFTCTDDKCYDGDGCWDSPGCLIEGREGTSCYRSDDCDFEHSCVDGGCTLGVEGVRCDIDSDCEEELTCSASVCAAYDGATGTNINVINNVEVSDDNMTTLIIISCVGLCLFVALCYCLISYVICKNSESKKQLNKEKDKQEEAAQKLEEEKVRSENLALELARKQGQMEGLAAMTAQQPNAVQGLPVIQGLEPLPENKA